MESQQQEETKAQLQSLTIVEPTEEAKAGQISSTGGDAPAKKGTSPRSLFDEHITDQDYIKGKLEKGHMVTGKIMFNSKNRHVAYVEV